MTKPKTNAYVLVHKDELLAGFFVYVTGYEDPITTVHLASATLWDNEDAAKKFALDWHLDVDLYKLVPQLVTS